MTSQNLDRIDWNSLPEEELLKIEESLKKELSLKEQRDADMRVWGKLIFFRARKLNWKYNQEILTVLCEWIDDPDMLKRHEIKDERVYDWAAMKRDQRNYDRTVQAEKLKEYWKRIKAKKQFYQDLARTIANKERYSKFSDELDLSNDFLSDIVEPFSPETQEREKLEQEFLKLSDIHEVHRIPWKQILLSEIRHKEQASLLKLTKYTEHDKLELVVKFSTLLSLETRGKLEMTQEEPFGDPYININQESEIEPLTVKTKEGHVDIKHFDEMETDERIALIQKAKNGELICM